MMQEEQPLQVARCTKIIQAGDETRYLINIKQIAKFVVALGDRVAPTDIEEGMRVGYVLRAGRTARAPAIRILPDSLGGNGRRQRTALAVRRARAASTAPSTKSSSRCRPRSTRP